MRPDRLIVVSGTATEIGKTYVGAAVARAWRAQGLTVAARKPVQSYEADTPESSTDAGVLAAATGEAVEDVCPRHRWYPVPMAPPMAADVLGLPPFTVADLAAEIVWPAGGVAIGMVEGVGGPRSPLAADGDTVALADALGADNVLLVADAGLGTINAVRLSAGVFSLPVTVFLNRFDPGDDLHCRNERWLADEGYSVVTTAADPPGNPQGQSLWIPERVTPRPAR